MASISSTNSSSSLGNTSLRGFGGMASGIDRDAIIEKMTLGTTTKINNQKSKITQLEWKQEAYRSISDKILDWSDTYASYSSSNNLLDPGVFSKNQITVQGAETSTRFVTATGSSSMVDNVSLLGVNKLATSTVVRSKSHTSENGLETSISDLYAPVYSSNLADAKLSFVIQGSEGQTLSSATFNFASSYTDADGKTQTIDYVPQDGQSVEDWSEELVGKLNDMLANSDAKIGEENLKDVFEFAYDENTGKIGITEKKSGTGVKISVSSSALTALGYDKTNAGGTAVELNKFNDGVTGKLSDKAVNQPTTLDYLAGKSLTFNYDGSQKSIQLITKDEAAAIKTMTVDMDKVYGDGDENNAKLLQALKNAGVAADGDTLEDISLKMEDLDNLIKDATGDDKEVLEAAKVKAQKNQVASNLQARLNQAFGTGMVTVDFTDKLTFDTKNETSTLSVISNDNALLSNMGLSYGSSNKVNLSGKLNQSALSGLGLFDDDGKLKAEYKDGNNLALEINGVKIGGLTENSTISDIISKINSTTAAGVKATYVESTGEFMLVSSETGAGREINLGGGLAEALFGGGTTKEGQNAQILVSYGNGMNVMIERASNTFNLEGLNVTVSGEFGDIKQDESGEWITGDSSQTITFSAKADVDGALEKVKQFIEDYNALVTEIDSQLKTRPDSNYAPLTDDQKAEMDATSIENWENKAKQGILYGDSIIRDLSVDIQGIFTQMMNNGATYEDLQEIGISYSDSWDDGGTLVFDEAKFKEAMESDPDKVANIFTGGGNVKKGLINTINDMFTPYATRYANKNGNGAGGSYGSLIEMAGSEKKPTTLLDNEIYKQLKEMQETIDSLNERLKVEQDRYISQFTTMESLINQMNTQASYLSQIMA